MTTASTRPIAPPSPSTGGDPPPPPPLPRPVARITPPARWTTGLLIIGGAFVTNLAIQGRAASVASLAAIVIGALVILAAPGRRTASVSLSVGIAMLAGSNLVLRTSDWVTGPTLATSTLLLVLASLDQLMSARPSAVGDTIRVWFAGLVGSVRHLVSPVMGLLGPESDRRRAVIRGIAIALSVGVLLTSLLANADAVVWQFIGDALQSSTWAHLVVSAAMAVVFATVAVVAHDPRGLSDESWAPRDRPIEAMMGLGAMAVVLGSWVAVQATVALGGADRLLATASVTRAEHAREGFFELVTVVAVVLVLLAVFGRLLGRHKAASALVLLGGVGSLTALLVAITFSRLSLYIDAFGLTMLRLSVAWFLGWLAFLVVAAAAWSAGVGAGRGWLTPLVVTSAALVVTAFGWSNPEATVASTNLARDNAVVRLDVDYLKSLGPDAAPVLAARGVKTGPDDCSGDTQPYGPFGWNRSRASSC